MSRTKIGKIMDYSKVVMQIYLRCFIPKWKEYLKQKTIFPHPVGICISPAVKLGKNIRIYQNVTIGSHKKGVPKICDDVIIYCNSSLFGNVTIGKGAIIGAGSVITKDIKEYEVWGGNPAKKLY
jgi:serine O-acetyltransferase